MHDAIKIPFHYIEAEFSQLKNCLSSGFAIKSSTIVASKRYEEEKDLADISILINDEEFHS